MSIIKKILTITFIAASVTVLTGCYTTVAPTSEASHTPTVETEVGNDYQDRTFEEFTAAFPDLDTSALRDIKTFDNIVITQNGREWNIGNGQDGYYQMRVWMENYAVMDLSENGHYGIGSTADRDISFFIRSMPVEGHPDAFIAQIVSSK